MQEQQNQPPEDEKHEAELREFLAKYPERVRQWELANPRRRVPVYWDPVGKKFYWANRKQRRT